MSTAVITLWYRVGPCLVEKNLAALAAAGVADSEQHAVVVVVVYRLAEAERPDDNCEKIFQFLL